MSIATSSCSHILNSLWSWHIALLNLSLYSNHFVMPYTYFKFNKFTISCLFQMYETIGHISSLCEISMTELRRHLIDIVIDQAVVLIPDQTINQWRFTLYELELGPEPHSFNIWYNVLILHCWSVHFVLCMMFLFNVGLLMTQMTASIIQHLKPNKGGPMLRLKKLKGPDYFVEYFKIWNNIFSNITYLL